MGVLLGAYFTLRLSIVTTVGWLVALDLGFLIYWFYGRAGQSLPAGRRSAGTPMRSLAEVISVAGVLLIVNALWLTVLGFMTEFGITNETTANWSALAATGLQVRSDQPAAFGARCLVVAVAVWAVGFGLTKASGEKA